MFEKSFSLEKLSEFIGRKAILQDVRGWMLDGNFHLVFIRGEYGIGKTRLLQQILNLTRNEPQYSGAPANLIDLYHFRHHSPEGLARAIVNCFENTENEAYFQFYISARRKLEEARAAGDSKSIREQLQQLLDSCVDGLKKMSSERGLLLLFDTIEQYVYPTGAHLAPAWDWLKSWIGDLPRGVILFAGHSVAEILFQDLPLATVSLAFFTLEESRSYLVATADRWSRETGLLVSFTEDDIIKLHILSQGRPILLALFLELRMHDPQVFRNLSELHTETFEQKIMEYLLNQPELGETLKAAGRTPKGINTELLAKIRGISLRDARQALENLKKMSFAKTFPHDESRVFLHDEMYTLLKKYAFSYDADTADRQAAAQAIYYYYKQAIKQKDEELKDIFASLSQGVDFEQTSESSEDFVPKIRTLEISRHQLKTEFLYYRLRHQIAKGDRKAHQDDPIQAGLKNYYRFGHESATSNNDEILIPLQIELTSFWLSLESENFWKPFIEGLLLIHKVWLKLATAQNYWGEISNYEKKLADIANLPVDQKTILLALLETWLGTGLVFAKEPSYERANKIFTEALDNLRKLSADQRLRWFTDVITSLAYRQRAYLHRIRGAFQNAIEDFRAGLRYSRAIDFFHEEATLRNDLGFSQMHMGLFLPALEDMQDGLQLRYKTAIGPRIALSHSSLAQFYIASGAYEEARKQARSAIQISEISERVGFWRGQAFGHLAFAEATRRYAFSFLDVSSQIKYLQNAHDAITVSIDRFEGLSEASRIIDSKLEEACIYRDRTRVETEPSKKRVWFDKSAKQLLEVAKEAQKAGIYYRQVDAMCNRVWLGYFSGDIDYALQAAGEFENLEILTPYWIKSGQYADEEKAKTDPVLWSHIGKYCMARGIIALDIWKEKKDNTALVDTARYFMLSMTYSTKFALDHRGLREGRRRIYQALNRLNHDELKQFCNHVLAAIKNEKISQTPSELQKFMEYHALWDVN